MPKEGKFYVEYLGWKETRGLYGSNFTDPIVKTLLTRQLTAKTNYRFTINIGRDELRVVQSQQLRGRTQKTKYPPVPLCDISYVTQCHQPNAAVVACIFLGYNSYTKCAAHVHCYRFESPESAAAFTKIMNSLIDIPEYKERIKAMEVDLLALGQISPRLTLPLTVDNLGSDGASNGCSSPNSSDGGYPTAEQALKQRSDITIRKSSAPSSLPSQQVAMNSVAAELGHKLSLQHNQEIPILLPPKDYDTIVRKHGHLSIRGKMRQRSILTANNIFSSDNRKEQAGLSSKPANSKLTKKESSDSTETDSNHSGSTDEQSVYGIYKGLKDVNDPSLEEMAMWSTEFSFGQSSSSHGQLEGSNNSAGLRRMKIDGIF